MVCDVDISATAAADKVLYFIQTFSASATRVTAELSWDTVRFAHWGSPHAANIVAASLAAIIAASIAAN